MDRMMITVSDHFRAEEDRSTLDLFLFGPPVERWNEPILARHVTMSIICKQQRRVQMRLIVDVYNDSLAHFVWQTIPDWR